MDRPNGDNGTLISGNTVVDHDGSGIVVDTLRDDVPLDPDFCVLAREILTGGVCDQPMSDTLIAAKLRLLWNARGAADEAKIHAVLESSVRPDLWAGRFISRAIMTLDR